MIIDNLVVGVEEDSTITAFVLRYEPSQKWYNGPRDFSRYTGVIAYYSLEGERLASMELYKGREVKDSQTKTFASCELERFKDGGWICTGGFYGTTDCRDPYEYKYICDDGGTQGGTLPDDHDYDYGNDNPIDDNDNGSGTGGTGDDDSGDDGGVTTLPLLEDDRDNDSEADAATAFEEQIDDTNLDPCLKRILEELKKIDKGVGEIILEFSEDNINFNWKLKNGKLVQANASTSTYYDTATGTVTTTFDPTKFSNASKLSAARTILHESIHAYIVASFGSDYIISSKTFADFLHDYNQGVYPTRNDTGHAEFVRNYVQDIAITLQQYGTNQGLTLTSQFYRDIAWGGLTHWPKRDSVGTIIKDPSGNIVFEETPWFKSTFPNTADRNRIKNNILIEQTGRDIYGIAKNQKGSSVGC